MHLIPASWYILSSSSIIGSVESKKKRKNTSLCQPRKKPNITGHHSEIICKINPNLYNCVR